jgi:hypothetical protein
MTHLSPAGREGPNGCMRRTTDESGKSFEHSLIAKGVRFE